MGLHVIPKPALPSVQFPSAGCVAWSWAEPAGLLAGGPVGLGLEPARHVEPEHVRYAQVAKLLKIKGSLLLHHYLVLCC